MYLQTVHIFKLDENSASGGTGGSGGAGAPQTTVGSVPEGGGSFFDYVGKAIISGSSSLLPAAMSDVFAQGRSFATAKLSLSGIPCVAALTTVERQCRLLVASTAGYLYVYNVNTETGGECTFLRQHNLIDDQLSSGSLAAGGGSMGASSTSGTAATGGPAGSSPATAGGGTSGGLLSTWFARSGHAGQQQQLPILSSQEQQNISESFSSHAAIIGARLVPFMVNSMSYAQVTAGGNRLNGDTSQSVEGRVNEATFSFFFRILTNFGFP